MTSRDSAKLGVEPGTGYRNLRRVVQTCALLAVVLAPLLGGFQRNNRGDMAAWDAGGFDLARGLREVLPVGEAAARAHTLNLLKGGGIASELFGIAAMDPLAGTLALMERGLDGRGLVALSLPIVLGLLMGRFFCGWLCPFGTLARWLDAIADLLPLHRRIALPSARLLRVVLVAVSLLVGFAGFHLVLYLLLPYLLLQQAVYALWLLGGSSVALSLMVGLLLAGLLFGPTTYCATLCPTGGVLAWLGRWRRVRLTVSEPKACGRHCQLCSRACWLSLDPASGDPGPECDLCARCVPACPRTNLVVTFRRSRKSLPVVTGCLLALSLPSGEAHAEPAADRVNKPNLVLDVERELSGVTLAISAVDMTGVEYAGGTGLRSGVEVSVFMARGERGPPDERGLLPSRDVYRGPLTLAITRGDGRVTRVPFEAPNSPRSTQRRAIYLAEVAESLTAGDEISILPVPGWLDDGASFAVESRGVDPGPARWVAFGLAGGLLFAGLLSLAIIPLRRQGGPGRPSPDTSAPDTRAPRETAS